MQKQITVLVNLILMFMFAVLFPYFTESLHYESNGLTFAGALGAATFTFTVAVLLVGGFFGIYSREKRKTSTYVWIWSFLVGLNLLSLIGAINPST